MALGDLMKRIRATSSAIFRIGKGGQQLESEGTSIAIRNAADSDYAELRALLVSIYGDDVVLNAGATLSAASWKFTITRPSTGMTESIELVLPSGVPAPGQAMTVASEAAGVITLEWTTIAGGADKLSTETTALAFGTVSPLTLFTLPANAVIWWVKVFVDTAFNGTAPTLSIGIAGTTSKYMGTADVDLKTIGIYDVEPGQVPVGTTEALIATYVADTSAAGAGRIVVGYSIPA